MLDNLRKNIDKLDEQIVELLAKRIEIVKKIGEFKKQNNLPIVDKNRFDKVLERVEKKAIQRGLSPNFVKELYEVIHKYSCEVEK